MRSLIILVVLLSGCANTDPWRTRDTVGQVLVTTALIADAVTTTKIQYHDGIYEDGSVARRVLGSQPKTSDTYQYFGTLIISNYLISKALPEKWRPYWQYSNFIYHGVTVHNNCDLGLC